MTKWLVLVLGAALLISAPAGSQSALAQDAMMIKAASFKGVGGHASSGDVAIVKEANGHKIVFKSNFRLDGAPDPKIAFGKNGYVKGTIFAKLGKLKGEQSYGVPASYDLSNFNEIWLWCEKFNVPLAVAALK